MLRGASHRDAQGPAGGLNPIMQRGLVVPCILAASVIAVAIWGTLGPPKPHWKPSAHFQLAGPP
jgi:hypothetical protein